MGKKTILKDYINFKKTSVKSILKLKDIERDTWKFIDSSKKSLDKFEEKELVSFLNSISNKYETSSLNGMKAGLKNFIKWYYIDYSTRFRNLDRLCKTEKPIQTYQAEEMLSEKEINKMASAEKDMMWKVYLLVLFYGGFRPTECCKIKWENISFERGGAIIKIFSTKNKKYFYKSIPSHVAILLKQWREFNPSEWVFPSPMKEGFPIMFKSVYYRITNLSKKVLGKKVVPYSIRHSIATIKYNDDSLKDDDVAQQLGHTKNMKAVYSHLDEKGIKNRARKIWDTSKLSPDKKHQLEKEIEELKEKLSSKNLQKEIGKIMKGYLQQRKDLNDYVFTFRKDSLRPKPDLKTQKKLMKKRELAIKTFQNSRKV